jgi:hypothetical protein
MVLQVLGNVIPLLVLAVVFSQPGETGCRDSSSAGLKAIPGSRDLLDLQAALTSGAETPGFSVGFGSGAIRHHEGQ